MKPRIKRLAITRFRGATTPFALDLDVSKQMVVIFGENGSGKSTIVDAIDFVTNESPGSLGNKLSTKSYLPALGNTSGSLQIELEASGQRWHARLAGAKVSVSGHTANRPLAHILRRDRIFGLLRANPGDRYKEIERFVDVPLVDAAEINLRKAIKDTKNDFDQASRGKAKADAQLEQFWNDEGRPGRSAIEWARTLVSQDQLEAEEMSRQANILVERFDKTSHREECLSEKIGLLSQEKEAVVQARAQLVTEESRREEVDALLMNVLESAECYFEAHPDQPLCPVCENPVDPAQLVLRIRERRAIGARIDDARKQVTSTEKRVEMCETARESAAEQLARKGAELLNAVVSCTLPETAALGVEGARFPSLDSARLTEAGANEEAVKQARDLLALLMPVKQALVELRTKAGSDAVRFNAVRRFLDEIDGQECMATREKGLRDQLEAMLGILEKRRKEFVDRELSAIAERVCALYGRIHPGEDIGEIELALDAKKRASLALTANFHGACAVPPEAYFSESHLDTLGICVFIALAEKACDVTRGNVLVLDDVLTSIDGPHMGRFMSMLCEEMEQFDQVIVTTHYRHWFESFKRGQGPAKTTQLLELVAWSIGTGIGAEHSPLPTDELQDLLRSPRLDRQAIAIKAGIILERLLKHLALCYRLRLPASQRHHSLGDLRSAVSRKLKAICLTEQINGSEQGIRVPLGPALDAIDSLAFIRNWVGGHDNPLGDDVPNNDVVRLGEQTLELALALICDSCGALPGKVAESHWRCHCRKKRLYPLALPNEDLPRDDVVP